MEGLMLSPLGSCLMAGETMAGWGMPVWWRLCGGGVTMWGEKRLDTKLRGRKPGESLLVGLSKRSSVDLTGKVWAHLAHQHPAFPSGWNSLFLLPASRLNSLTQCVPCSLFFVQIKTFQKPLYSPTAGEKWSVVLPWWQQRRWYLKPVFLPRSRPRKSFLTAVHTEPLYKVSFSIPNY